jgi:hypothetical protein
MGTVRQCGAKLRSSPRSVYKREGKEEDERTIKKGGETPGFASCGTQQE